MKTPKLILVNLLILVGLLLLVELAVRFFTAKNDTFPKRRESNVLYSPSGFTRKWMNESQTVYAETDGEFLKDKPMFHINGQGFRDDDDIPVVKDPHEIRIAILGGSHVFDLNCFDYQDNPGFPADLEKELKAKGITCRVINAGEPGADCQDFPARILNSLSRYHPDYIIINSTWNDLKWIGTLSDTSLINKTPPMAVQKNPMIEPVNVYDRALGWSVVYRKLRDQYWRKKLDLGSNKGINEGIAATKKGAGNGDYTKGLEQYKLTMAASIRLAELVGAKPVLAIEERLVSTGNTADEKKLIQYHMTSVKTHEELVSLFASCDSIIKTLAAEYNVPLIDANKTVGGSTKYFADHVHTTPAGSKEIARQYCGFFMDSVLKWGKAEPQVNRD